MESTLKIRETALRMLTFREHSRLELKKKLLQKCYQNDLVEEILQNLVESNLLDDKRFTEMYIRSRIAKNYGPRRIMMELRERGVAKTLIEECLLMYSNEFWIEQAEKIRNKKFGKTRDHTMYDHAKQIRYLQYKGFSPEQANAIVRFNE